VNDLHGGLERYEYDHAFRLTYEMTRCGEEYWFRYDERGRCVETSGRAGYNRKVLGYNETGRSTQVLDSNGNMWLYYWNVLHQVLASVSPLGAAEATEYDEYGRIVKTIDPLGRATSFDYDQHGNRIRVKYPNGAETLSAFDEEHRLLSITDPSGAQWRYEYHTGTHHLKQAIYPTGLIWDFAIGSGGDLIAVQNSAGGEWHFGYDVFGERTSITDESGRICRFGFDVRGNMVEIIDPEGAITRYEYDGSGRLFRVMHADGSTRIVTYDQGARPVIIETDGLLTSYEYGSACGQLRRVTERGGRVTEYIWGSEPDQLMAVIDPSGERHSFTYNEDGYLIEERFPNGRTISYARDSAGFVRERTNGAGETTIFERDAVGRIIRALFFDGSEVRFQYDACGLEVFAENSEGIVEIERDITGERVRESFNGFVVVSQYDQMGQRIARRSSLGGATTYRRDVQGRVVEVGLSETLQLRRELDRMGREVSCVIGGTEITSAYDGIGRLIERRANRVSGHEEWKQRVSHPSTTSHRRFLYDQLGGLIEVWDRRWGSTSFRYDLEGHVREVVRDNEVVERYQYDANENVISLAHLRTGVEGLEGPEEPQVRVVGAGNQILASGPRRYEYDADGRLVRIVEGEAPNERVWRFTWNPMGLPASLVSPDSGEWRYDYDAFGRRIRKSGPSGSIRYLWDGNAVMHEVREGNPIPETTWTFWPESFVPVAKQQGNLTYVAITDHLGTPLELVSEDGSLAWAARFTLWGELDELIVSDVECELRFQGQWYDGESGLHYNGSRYYSPQLAGFLSMDPVTFASGLNAYAYVPDPLRWIDPHGLVVEPWPLDHRGRPTGASGTLTRRDLRPTDSSPPTFDPPGWQGGGHPHHQQRSHVVADTLGGSGSDPRNLVTLTDGSNHPGMSSVEGRVRRHIQQNGGPVSYEVRVNYRDNHQRPSSVHIRAVDKHGNVIADERIANGRRQRSGCCP
jgi:RHS repeat-associated protein